ncbi:MAG: FeoC-like transcriptional regulator [Bacteroidia bacterium]
MLNLNYLAQHFLTDSKTMRHMIFHWICTGCIALRSMDALLIFLYTLPSG